MRKSGGFTLLEMIAVMMIMGFITIFIANYINMGVEEISKKAAAQQLKDVAEAARLYIADNYSMLQNTATDTTAAVVTLANLTGGGYLPASIGTNPWNQTYTVYVLEPIGKNLEGLVLTSGGMSSGDSFQNRLMPATAALAGIVGGYVPSGKMASQPTNVIQGAFGAWKLDISGTTIPNPGPGHLAAYVPFAENAATSDYLYRSAVPGHPEANQMWTDLDMFGNDVENARSLNLQSVDSASIGCDDLGIEEGRVWYDDAADGFYVCIDGVKRKLQTTGDSAFIQDVSVVSPGDAVAKPTCPADLPLPQIFLYPESFAANTTGAYIKGVQVWATNLSATQWQANMQVMTDLGWITPDASYGKMVALTKCSP